MATETSFLPQNLGAQAVRRALEEQGLEDLATLRTLEPDDLREVEEQLKAQVPWCSQISENQLRH